MLLVNYYLAAESQWLFDCVETTAVYHLCQLPECYYFIYHIMTVTLTSPHASLCVCIFQQYCVIGNSYEGFNKLRNHIVFLISFLSAFIAAPLKRNNITVL